MENLKFVKEASSTLLELIKKYGYWSNEVNNFNNDLINKIGVSTKYYIIQELAKRSYETEI